MPKIGPIFPEPGGNTVFTLWYTQKELFHIKDLPEEFIRLTRFRHCGWNSEAELKKALRKTWAEYLELIKQEEKIIYFKITASNQIIMNRTGNGFSGFQEWVPKIMRHMVDGGHDNYGFNFSFTVYKKVKKGDTTEFYNINPDGTLGMRSHGQFHEENILTYTEEAEAFFKNMADAMIELAKRMGTFFSGTKEELQARILSDGGRLLLQAPTSKKIPDELKTDSTTNRP